MIRQELQAYFDKVFPYSKIDTEHTLGGQVHIRFELGSGKENGTAERVKQSTDRALTIFNDTFPDVRNEIFIVVYDYEDEDNSNSSLEYLCKQFSKDKFNKFYNKIEKVNTRYYTKDENGNDVLEKDEARILIGKLPIKDINVRNILNGIANNEMGFKPRLDQIIFFFDPLYDKAFQMYDDRGCYVWSNTADKIRDIYTKRNEWIVDYHRPEIDEHFK